MVKEKEQAGLILAIESAVAGGSISLVRDGISIAGKAGGGSVSRAEDLLSGIDGLLKEAGVEKADLHRVAVSIGPGSFTGLRIGISTAMGLSTALEIPCVGLPLFDAIAARESSTIIIVVPLGRSDLCYRSFDSGVAREGFHVGDMAAFAAFVQSNRPERIAYHPDVDISNFDVGGSDTISLIDMGYNLAEYVGRYASHSVDTGPLEPIYVRNPRFG